MVRQFIHALRIGGLDRQRGSFVQVLPLCDAEPVQQRLMELVVNEPAQPARHDDPHEVP
jgi:hypothetical protein